MALFIVLGNFTLEGIVNIKDSPSRFEAANKVIESLGASIKNFYYTMGRYDFVAIIEAPNFETMIKGLFIVCGAGAIRTETLQALPLEKGVDIIKDLP